jgi:hypothetical protein
MFQYRTIAELDDRGTSLFLECGRPVAEYSSGLLLTHSFRCGLDNWWIKPVSKSNIAKIVADARRELLRI